MGPFRMALTAFVDDDLGMMTVLVRRNPIKPSF
jgi:hypothetical protein